MLACFVPYRPLRKKVRNCHPGIVIDRHVRRYKHKINFQDIPIFIISFNRFESLVLLLDRLEGMGYTNLQILDNHSTYPPLVKFLATCPYKVHYLSENYGHLAFWKEGRFQYIIQNSFYVVTDPDVVPVDTCPDDFLKTFYDILCQYPTITKVGFSLKIDDLPDCYELREIVMEWEKQFYKNQLGNGPNPLYKGAIDTTFALYGPQKVSPVDYNFYEAIRVGSPYEARHLPWYKDLANKNEEDLFYLATCMQNVNTWNGVIDSDGVRKRYGMLRGTECESE